MSEMMIKFVNCGVYKSEEQAVGIANALLMATCFNQSEYARVIVAIQEKFNPQPVTIEESPIVILETPVEIPIEEQPAV